VYQNQGWIAQASGMESRLAFGALMLGNLAAGLGVAWAFARPPTHHPVVALAAAAYLALAALTADREGSGFLLTLLVGQLLMGWGLAILGVFTLRADRPGLARTTVGMTGGMLLLLIMAFVYYVGLDIALPIPRASILPAAAVLLGASYLFVTLHLRRAARASVQQPVSLWPIAALFLLPVLVGVGQSPPRFDDPPGGPFRVMTYNIHSAYNTQGRQDPEAIARAIEANQPDVVALQEVSRGWLIDGSTDLPAWLSRRLGMPFLFRGTPDPVWGNAILSRYPILQHGSGGLPRDGTLLARGYLWADIDVGAAQPLRLINTHLHHIGRDSQVRQAQVSVLIGFWNDTPFSVLLGDLNAEPGSPEMEMLAQAGLADSWAEAGEGPGYTFRSDDPYQRIDWIWHTPDLRVREVRVVGDQASDHLGVVVRLEAVP
jgi:endonuclease/exonuclease/phosphatase family metal-dependent hydrolase